MFNSIGVIQRDSVPEGQTNNEKSLNLNNLIKTFTKELKSEFQKIHETELPEPNQEIEEPLDLKSINEDLDRELEIIDRGLNFIVDSELLRKVDGEASV